MLAAPIAARLPFARRRRGALKADLKQAVVSWPFGDLDFETFVAASAEMGLHGIDYLDPKDWPMLEKYGLICTMSRPPEVEGSWNKVEDHAVLVPAFRSRIEEVGDAGYPNIIAFSGNRDGVSDEEGLENCAAGLEQIMSAAERNDVTVTIEILNSKVDHKGYMFDNMEWGIKLVDRVGSDHLKILYDIYHAQIMEGDIIRTMREYRDYIAHIHTAGNPGRNEIDDSQELNYVGISRAIRDLNTDWYVAHEFRPTGPPLESLEQAVRICDV